MSITSARSFPRSANSTSSSLKSSSSSMRAAKSINSCRRSLMVCENPPSSASWPTHGSLQNPTQSNLPPPPPDWDPTDHPESPRVISSAVRLHMPQKQLHHSCPSACTTNHGTTTPLHLLLYNFGWYKNTGPIHCPAPHPFSSTILPRCMVWLSHCLQVLAFKTDSRVQYTFPDNPITPIAPTPRGRSPT